MRWTRLLLHVAAAATILAFVYPRASRERRRTLLGWWGAKLVRIFGITTHVQGERPTLENAGALIAANHVSWLDVFVVSGVCPTRFIAKSEIRDWPIAGWIADRAETLFVRRARRRDTARINELVHAALAQRDCVGLFPEGTTTEGETLLRFHSSLLEPAVANGARVYPVAIRYQFADGSLCRPMAYDDLSFMQSAILIARQRGVIARVAFGEPIDTRMLHRRDVAHRARATIATLLGLSAPDTRPGTTHDRPAAPR